MKTIPKSLPNNKTIRCLIIQTSTLENVMINIFALKTIKRFFPQLEIYFLTLKDYIPAAQQAPWIEEIIEFPKNHFLDLKKDSLRNLAEWIRPIVSGRWDFLVNWSFTKSSSYLTAIIPSRVKLGYTRRRDLSFSATDAWSRYFHGIIQNDIPQNIHLIDILTTQLLTALQIHVGEPKRDDADYYQKELNGIKKEKRIAIQLSSKDLLYPVQLDNWIYLIQKILKQDQDCSILLIGDFDQEIIKKNKIFHFDDHPRIEIFCETKIPLSLYISKFSNCQWLFTSQSATAHLASLLNLKVIAILEKNEALETGPYGNGHYIIQNKTQKEITFNILYSVWAHDAYKNTYFFSSENQEENLDDIRIFKSKIRKNEEGGGVTYHLITKEKKLLFNEWVSLVTGYIARCWYCGWAPKIDQIMHCDNAIQSSFIQRIVEIAVEIPKFEELCTQAKIVTGAIHEITSQIKSEKIMPIQIKNQIHALGQSLNKIENEMKNMKNKNFIFSIFTEMTSVLMHHLKGTSLAELSQETQSVYKQIHEGVLILSQWVDHTLRLKESMEQKNFESTTQTKKVIPLSLF